MWCVAELDEEIYRAHGGCAGRVRRLAVESVHGALHPQTRQLVEPGGNCHQPILPAMLGPTPHGDRFSLRKETRAWNRRANRDRVTIQWSFIRKQARHKFGYKITRSRY